MWRWSKKKISGRGGGGGGSDLLCCIVFRPYFDVFSPYLFDSHFIAAHTSLGPLIAALQKECITVDAGVYGLCMGCVWAVCGVCMEIDYCVSV